LPLEHALGGFAGGPRRLEAYIAAVLPDRAQSRVRSGSPLGDPAWIRLLLSTGMEQSG
jgi:hypothetical protein